MVRNLRKRSHLLAKAMDMRRKLKISEEICDCIQNTVSRSVLDRVFGRFAAIWRICLGVSRKCGAYAIAEFRAETPASGPPKFRDYYKCYNAVTIRFLKCETSKSVKTLGDRDRERPAQIFHCKIRWISPPDRIMSYLVFGGRCAVRVTE